MKKHLLHTFSFHPCANQRSSRGYTIIVVMLIMIMLSGLGIIALNTVNFGVQEANMQKMQREAFETSTSSVNLFSQYAGANAPQLVRIYEADFKEKSSSSDPNARTNWALYLPRDKMMGLVLGPSNASTPTPFSNATTNETWERARDVNFSLVVRDLTDGYSAPGYSESFCFKRVLLSGEATVGLTSANTANGTTFANSLTAQETLIGPIRCGSGG